MRRRSIESIAVSLFVYDLVEFDKYCIRQQDPNIYSDTEARCLVYSNVAITIMAMIIMMSMCWYSNVAITTTCSKKKRSLPDEEYGERERASSEPEELLSGKRESEQARQPR